MQGAGALGDRRPGNTAMEAITLAVASDLLGGYAEDTKANIVVLGPAHHGRTQRRRARGITKGARAHALLHEGTAAGEGGSIER